MARKGVNLLEGDDEEREGDSDGDSGDDGGSYERRRGGFVDVLMVILFVCVMLGGVAWAGYQFWWLPKMKKTEQLKTARITQEQQRKMRLAKMRGATERAQQTPGASGQFQQNQSPQEQKRGLRGAEQNIPPARPAPSRSAAEPISPAASMMNQKAAPRRPAEKAPLAAAPIMEKPAIPSRAKTRPKQQMVMAAGIPEKKAPAKTTAPVRPSPRRQLAAEKKTEKAKAKIRGETGIRKPSQGYYYSVQVASCRTGRCAETFSKRLKGKGFSVFKVAGTSRARRSSSRMTEVRLGSFSSLAEARALASEARKKKIGARVYRYNNRWRVAAGSFRNLEDAALLLDRAEDSGFRGELASRLQSGGTRRLYRIRTGKFESLRDALAFRKKIRLAGFSDAIVVRRRSRK
ncbi:MAG: SPOR domain-containing protein [Nitrospinae bacterium]|nr:SPOR domain-containing protein [Nitrospinota bacterium]